MDSLGIKFIIKRQVHNLPIILLSIINIAVCYIMVALTISMVYNITVSMKSYYSTNNMLDITINNFDKVTGETLNFSKEDFDFYTKHNSVANIKIIYKSNESNNVNNISKIICSFDNINSFFNYIKDIEGHSNRSILSYSQEIKKRVAIKNIIQIVYIFGILFLCAYSTLSIRCMFSLRKEKQRDFFALLYVLGIRKEFIIRIYYRDIILIGVYGIITGIIITKLLNFITTIISINIIPCVFGAIIVLIAVIVCAILEFKSIIKNGYINILNYGE